MGPHKFNTTSNKWHKLSDCATFNALPNEVCHFQEVFTTKLAITKLTVLQQNTKFTINWRKQQDGTKVTWYLFWPKTYKVGLFYRYWSPRRLILVWPNFTHKCEQFRGIEWLVAEMTNCHDITCWNAAYFRRPRWRYKTISASLSSLAVTSKLRLLFTYNGTMRKRTVNLLAVSL